MSHNEVVIVCAVRTAVGALNGMYKAIPAHALGAAVIRNILECTKVNGSDVNEVILGQVITSGAGPNPARQAALNAGLPVDVPAWCINQLCGSGLLSVSNGYHAIRSGDADIVIAGGQENMSRTPHIMPLRGEWGEGGARFSDAMMQDAMIDPFHHIHTVGIAENIARKYNISREEQDEFSVKSQNKYQKAKEASKFKEEIVPVLWDEQILDEDEMPRDNVSLATLSRLKPVALRNGTVTAGNTSGISDGAAAVMLMSTREAERRNLEPMAVIRSWANVGVEPSTMGTGPVPASKKALLKAGWKTDGLDMIEANESFATQAIYVNQQMQWDVDKINPNGGAIAIGHPFGASGARLLTTLLHEMPRQNAKRAIATLCVGGGMGVAMCVERT